jgi:hypothetical protein
MGDGKNQESSSEAVNGEAGGRAGAGPPGGRGTETGQGRRMLRPTRPPPPPQIAPLTSPPMQSPTLTPHIGYHGISLLGKALNEPSLQRWGRLLTAIEIR